MLREKYSTNDVGVSFAVVMIAYIAVQLAVTVIAQIFNVDIEANTTFYIVASAVNTAVIGASAFVYAAITKAKVAPATKMNVKPPIAHIGWGCLATLFLMSFMLPLNGWISQLIVSMGLPEPSVDIPGMNIVAMIFVAAILPAFCEEVIFRGTIAQALEGNKNKLASLAIVGGLFAIFHMNPAQTVHQFVLGAFLALLVYRSGSLWTAVVVHFFNNIVVIALSAIFGESADEFFAQNAIWLFFVGLICFAGCAVGYLFTTKSKWRVDDEQTKIKGGSLAMLLIAAGVCLFVWILTLIVPTNGEPNAEAVVSLLNNMASGRL